MSYEIHVGEVSGLKDPEKRGRLKVKFQTIFEGEYPEWVDPCFPFAGSNCGWFFVPPIGTAVECEVYRGKGPDVSIDTPKVRWRAPLYNRVDSIPEEFRDRYPYSMGFKSPSGHVLVFDDMESREFILLGHAKKLKTFLCFDRNGSVALHCQALAGGEFGFFLDATKGAVQVFGISSVDITARGHVNIKGAAVTIQGRPVMRNGEPI